MVIIQINLAPTARKICVFYYIRHLLMTGLTLGTYKVFRNRIMTWPKVSSCAHKFALHARCAPAVRKNVFLIHAVLRFQTSE